MTTVSAFRASRAIGAMFFSLLGSIWMVLWSNRAFGLQPVLLTLIALCALALAGSAKRVYEQNKAALAQDANSPAKKKADSVFHAVNAGQGILMFVTANILVNAGRREWVFASTMFIIGLHFLPLAHVFRYPPHYVTGAALILWSIGYSLATTSGPGNPVGCLGAGLILWTSALYGLLARPSPALSPLA